jgi:hypothetical protein
MAFLAKMQMYLFVKDMSINEDDYSDNRLIITITAMGMTAKNEFCHVEVYLSSVKAWCHFRFGPFYGVEVSSNYHGEARVY